LTTAKPSVRRVEREDVLLWLFAGVPVFAWIAAEQVSFLATRSICATGHRRVLYLVIGATFAATMSAGAASWTRWRALASKKPAGRIVTRRRFMALGALLLAAICAVSILALMIPAAVHRPCD
jgi:hypothetical protein